MMGKNWIKGLGQFLRQLLPTVNHCDECGCDILQCECDDP